MKKERSRVGFVVMLLMPLALVLVGAGLAALGVMNGSLSLVVAGLVVAGAGVLWGIIGLELTNPFDLF